MNVTAFREIVRTVTVAYPIPFMFASLLAVLLFCFSGAAFVRESLVWVFAATGVASFTVAVGLAIFAIVRRPDLLRSERYSLVNRYIDVVGDDEMNRIDTTALDRTMLAFLEEDVPKKAAPARGAPDNGVRDNANE
jgi:threonine/homoserine efflux transporter RhtA